MPVHPHVEREVTPSPGRDAHERDPVRRRYRGHDRQRPVAARYPERVRVGRRGFTGQRGQVLARGEDDGFDPLVARPVGQPGAAALPSPDLGLTNNTGRRRDRRRAGQP